VDSRATISFLRNTLTTLDDKMVSLESNVVDFNAYVMAQIRALSARGETEFSNLLENLLKGYKEADDAEFQDFIRRKKNAYEEGEDINVNNLIADTDTKYRARVQTHEWSAPTKEQSQIVALMAQVESLTKAKAKEKQPAAGASTATLEKKKRGKNPEWAWKDKMPKEGEATTKEFKGKHYHIDCKYHPKRWVCHSSADCSKNPANIASASASTPTDDGPAPEKKTSKRLKAAKLAAAILEDDDDDDGEFDLDESD
jgi:hypothetical protein